MLPGIGRIGRIGAPGEGVGFSLNAFLATQSGGFAFDFTKTDRFFQENTGPTLADDVGESIGLALESREWNGRTLAGELALATELRGTGSASAIGSPSVSSSYNPATGAGTIRRDNSTNQGFVQFFVGADPVAYVVDIENVSGGNINVRDFTTAVFYKTLSVGTRETIFVSSPAGAIKILTVDGVTANFVVHSVKLVPGKHATQATGSLKPTRQVFYGYSDDQPELLPNPSLSGAVDGIIGSGGALPDNWLLDVDGGLTYTVAVGADYIDLRISGTTSSTFTNLLFAGNADVVTTAGEVLRSQFDFQRVAGSNTNISSINQNVYQRTAAGTYVSQSPTALTVDTTRRTAVMVAVIAGATVARANSAISLAYSSGVAIDITLRLYSPSSLKKVPASRITTAAKGDGSDDNLLTTYTAGSGANFIVAYVNVPTTISAAQLFAGASDGASGNRFFVGFNTDGTFGAGVGANSVGVIKDTTDWRGKSAVFGVSFDGSTVRLFADDQIVYEAAQSGVPSSSTAVRIAGQNSGGTAGNFFSGQIADLLAGREFLTLERYLQIRNALINQ